MFRIFLLLPILSLYGGLEDRIRDYFYGPGVESLIVSDWGNPTLADYLLIQDHLRMNHLRVVHSPIDSRPFFTYRLNTELHGWITYRMGKIRLVSEDVPEPVFRTICFNGDPERKDRCVICYVSSHLVGSGADFPRGLNFLTEALRANGFDGHLLYRIGGWPSLKRGRLKYADVPYAFKPFLFEEARDLGYKKILWLDAAAIPVRSLDPIFSFLERQGCCFFASTFQRDFQANEIHDRKYILDAMRVSLYWHMRNILTQVVGIDTENPEAARLLDRWIEAATLKVPFLESSADQFAFAGLVSDLNLLKGILPPSLYVEGGRGDFTVPKQKQDAIIFHQYDFLHPDSVVPPDIFR